MPDFLQASAKLSTEMNSATNTGDIKFTELKCTWPECTDKRTFLRQSDLRKHVDKHTRPYNCTIPACNGINFGDKAGLLRHERERHGAARFLCQITTCTRNRRGFARKRNLDAHVRSRHLSIDRNTSMTSTTSENVAETSKSPESTESPEAMDESQDMSPDKEESSHLGGRELTGLQLKLRELERKKEELAACQLKIDDDIQAVKRTMELVAVA